MSKFAKALEQAQRDRALRNQGAPPPPVPAVPPLPATPRKIAAPPRQPAHITGDVDSHLVSLVAPAGLEAEQYRALASLLIVATVAA